jgi:hypothetical protein
VRARRGVCGGVPQRRLFARAKRRTQKATLAKIRFAEPLITPSCFARAPPPGWACRRHAPGRSQSAGRARRGVVARAAVLRGAAAWEVRAATPRRPCAGPRHGGHGGVNSTRLPPSAALCRAPFPDAQVALPVARSPAGERAQPHAPRGARTAVSIARHRSTKSGALLPHTACSRRVRPRSGVRACSCGAGISGTRWAQSEATSQTRET